MKPIPKATFRKPIFKRNAALALATLLAIQVTQADVLRVRMIRASHDEGDTPAELADIAAMLRKTIAFKSYSLDAETTVELPAEKAERKLRIYDLTCDGDAEKLKVQIHRRERCIVETVAKVRQGQPVVLGGFPARFGDGIRMFVLTLEPKP